MMAPVHQSPIGFSSSEPRRKRLFTTPFDMNSKVANRMRKGTRSANTFDGVRTNNHAPNAPPIRLVMPSRSRIVELFAITKEAAEETGPKRDGAGPIGDFWIESEPDENGKRQQRSSAGNGIDRARRKRGAEHDKHGEETHRGIVEAADFHG